MCTKPRLSGRNWQTDAMKPENGCTLAPAVSVEKIKKCICTSGEARSGRVREKRPHSRRR